MNSNEREFSFEIKAHLCVLSKSSKGWTKEVNLVAWNGNPEKFDVREWDPSHQHMSRGITLKKEEAEILVRAIYGQLKRYREEAERAAREAEAAKAADEAMAAELDLPVDEDGCVVEPEENAECNQENE